MAENKSYYYLKLKENFFDSDEMKILESMENGYMYSNILLKLYLKSLKDNGKLMFNEFIPYDKKMIAVITGHNIDIVEKALKIFNQMKLIELLDNGAIFMLNIQNMIGSISSEGIRKAEYRERIRIEKENKGTSLGQCPDIISIFNSNSNYIYNSNNIEEEKETKHKYGEFKKVLLKDSEFDKLNSEFGKEETEKAIKYLDEYIEMKGTKYKSHYMALRKWVFDAVKEKEKKNVSYETKPNKNLNYEQRKYSKEQLDGLFTNLDEVEI